MSLIAALTLDQVTLLNFRPRDVALHSGEELLSYMLAAWPSYVANKDFADRGRGPAQPTLLTFAIETGDEALVRNKDIGYARWRPDEHLIMSSPIAQHRSMIRC